MSTPLPDAGFYSSALGDSFQLRVTFSEPVTVSGELLVQFTVRVGDDDVDAAYSSGSGTTELTFELIYHPQHIDTDGVSVPAGSLALFLATTLKDGGGQDAVLTHGAFGPFARSLVNTPPPPPYITGIDIGSDLPDRGYYETGDDTSMCR